MTPEKIKTARMSTERIRNARFDSNYAKERGLALNLCDHLDTALDTLELERHRFDELDDHSDQALTNAVHNIVNKDLTIQELKADMAVSCAECGMATVKSSKRLDIDFHCSTCWREKEANIERLNAEINKLKSKLKSSQREETNLLKERNDMVDRVNALTTMATFADHSFRCAWTSADRHCTCGLAEAKKKAGL